MFVVEIITHGASLIDEMTAMRLWLDHQHFEPASFRPIIDERRVVFRVDFTVEAEAISFATAFGGKIAPQRIAI